MLKEDAKLMDKKEHKEREAMIERRILCPHCANDITDFVKAEAKPKKEEKKEVLSTKDNKGPGITADIKDVNWNELVKLAKEKGVNIKGMKKADVVEALKQKAQEG